MIAIDGREVRSRLRMAAEVVVVGSGPGGAAVAQRLAAAGVRALVLEEGHLHPPGAFAEGGLDAMAAAYRDLGTTIALGDAPMPVLQGRAVGGTSVVNGAICWSFPEEVHRAWVAADPALGDALPYEAIAREEAWFVERLRIRPTPPEAAGPKGAAMAAGAERLGWAHRPIARNVDGCRGSGRCLQGCPHGAKLSMDRTLLPDAVRDGARVVSGVRVEALLHDPRGVYGVRGTTAGGAPFEVLAERGVVVAASAIGTPLLLRASGLRHGPVGDGLQGHPGVSVTGRFAHPVAAGATQGHEVVGLRSEGLKLETLGFPRAILPSRVPGVGSELAARLAGADRLAVWGAAIRAEGRGTVRRGPLGPSITLRLTPADAGRVRLAALRLGQGLFAAGAEEVYPGVGGFDPVVRDPARLEALPVDVRAYPMSVTHLFGTARMGSDPATSVVRPDFRHHVAPGLWVADSSVFPTNLGVNPMLPILSVAARCAAAILA